MADIATIWQDLDDAVPAQLDTGKGVVRPVSDTPYQYLVSGNLAKAAAHAGVDAEGLGALARTDADTYSVRLARDRMLIVAKSEVFERSGYDEAGYAVTPVHGGMSIIDADPALAEAIIQRATSLELTGSGRSAMVEFAGVRGIVYFHGDRLRVHVDQSHARYIWTWLREALGMI